MTRDQHAVLAGALASGLARPPSAPGPAGQAQPLGSGAVGAALLHVERAASGLASWDTVRAWFTTIAGNGISAGPGASLYHGAPAVAFAMHGAAGSAGRYQRALASLDASVAAITRRRLGQAHARIDREDRPALAEFDLINGLTGLGACLLRRDPGGGLIRQVLTYLVRLTEPLTRDGLPGWWTGQAPTGSRPAHLPGGHGNFGMAHGIAGPLALLSLAVRHGITVPGQAAAISRICSWLDTWRQPGATGPWWPEIITIGETESGRPAQDKPLRPSWCYGTPGLARAQQLAGQATGDPGRQRMAELALAGCLADTAQTARITSSGLCHGAAGLYLTAWRIAAEAGAPELKAQLPSLATRLAGESAATAATGLLEGQAGVALALHTAATGTSPVTGWDTCLLLN